LLNNLVRHFDMGVNAQGESRAAVRTLTVTQAIDDEHSIPMGGEKGRGVGGRGYVPPWSFRESGPYVTTAGCAVQKENRAAERPLCYQLSMDCMLRRFSRDLDEKTSVRSLNYSNACFLVARILCEDCAASKKNGQPQQQS
jgi:hypothetical protein